MGAAILKCFNKTELEKWQATAGRVRHSKCFPCLFFQRAFRRCSPLFPLALSIKRMLQKTNPIKMNRMLELYFSLEKKI